MGKLCLCTSLDEIYLENCVQKSRKAMSYNKVSSIHVQAVLKQGYITTQTFQLLR